jgi:hypothetical protein
MPPDTVRRLVDEVRDCIANVTRARLCWSSSIISSGSAPAIAGRAEGIELTTPTADSEGHGEERAA